MDWIQHVFFLIPAILILASIVLVARSSMTGKTSLLGFLALALCSHAGYYAIPLVLNQGGGTGADHREFIETVSLVSALLAVLSWVLLIRFVLEARNQQVAVPVPPSAQPSGSRLGVRITAGVVLIAGALFGQFAGGLTPGEAPIGLVILACSGTSAVLAFKGSSSRKIMVSLVGVSLAILILLALVNPTHWKVADVWLFDILALALHGLGFVLVL